MVDFTDTSPTYSQTNFQNLLFGTDPSIASGPGSLSDYYSEVSYGQLSVTGNVVGWVTADKTHDYYGRNSGRMDANVSELIRESAQKVDSQVDFSQYDNDGDDVVDQFVVIHQGAGEEFSGQSTDIWSHHYSIDYQTNDGVTIQSYTIQPETQNGQISTTGVFAHEMGHAFGLPDLYDTDYSSAGIGDWGLMSSGSWNGVNRAGDSPAHLSAWSKQYLSWISPTTLQNGESLADKQIDPATTTTDFYQLRQPTSQQREYFLVGNRQRTGFDKGLPGSGVAIWHIDRSNIDNNCLYYNDCNDDENDKLVDLEAGDGAADLDNDTNTGNAADLWPSGTFDGSSTPSSDFDNGTASDVFVANIGSSGGASYTADFGVGSQTTHASVATGSASNVDSSSARLSGDLTDLGSAASVDVYLTYWIEGQKSSTQQYADGGTRTSTGSFSADASSLQSGTPYVFKAIGQEDDGDWVPTGQEQTFQTS
ncbi:M6 family metalloprotease domain-containing protein [Halorhabdus rudnickae]|uniref:M6 family metalloprotease domain-containing protein n=1 Tax=Halorhabdus rudnickae TaxID=1775544 RepID=UPI001083F8C3|nr:M6 family metalloprotease domain-containing protein [Halorhabdus rudnickae]